MENDRVRRASTNSNTINRRHSYDTSRRQSTYSVNQRESTCLPPLTPVQHERTKRRSSSIKQPFLLPTFNETNSSNEILSTAEKAKDNVDGTFKEKGLGFKGVAKAIINQVTLSNFLKVRITRFKLKRIYFLKCRIYCFKKVWLKDYIAEDSI